MAPIDEDDWQIYAEKKEYFISTLYERLSEAIKQNLEMLLKLQKRAPVNQIAWYVRNLLELKIWVEFCSHSMKNAAEFYEDAICDLVDLHRSSGPDNPEIMASLENAKKLISTPKAAHKYRKVADAAEDLGRKDDKGTWKEYYALHSKLLSKFVHPTAVSVVMPLPRHTIMPILRNFVEDGEEYAKEAMERLEESFIAEMHKHYAPAVAEAKRKMKKQLT